MTSRCILNTAIKEIQGVSSIDEVLRILVVAHAKHIMRFRNLSPFVSRFRLSGSGELIKPVDTNLLLNNGCFATHLAKRMF